MSRRTLIFSELAATLALALPVITGQLGVMLMGVVDVALVRPLGPAAVAALGVGGALQTAALLFGMGTLLGLDTVVATAFGAGNLGACRAALVQGLWLASGLAALLTMALRLVAAHLAGLGVAPDVVPLATAYLYAVSWGLWPTLLFIALRQTLQALGQVRAANFILVAANLVNAGGNQLFLFGGCGLPALGVAGSGWATTASRVFMLVALAAWVFKDRVAPWSFAFDRVRTMRIFWLGLPSGFFYLLDGGALSVVGILAARIGPAAGAAHHVALTVDSLAWMVPLGLSAAGAVRVGQALGRGDQRAAWTAGWTAAGLGLAFSFLTALLFVIAWRSLLDPFAPSSQVLALGRSLLLCAALYQIFDAGQATLSGALRGTGETLRPMLASFIGYWVIGLPTGVCFCYESALGVVGLWLGMSLGLAAVAMTLLVLWMRRTRTAG